MKMKLTQNEAKLMMIVAADEYNTLNGDYRKAETRADLQTLSSVPEWAQEMGLTKPQTKGVLGSLCAKGLLTVDGVGADSDVCFTEAGFDYILDYIR